MGKSIGIDNEIENVIVSFKLIESIHSENVRKPPQILKKIRGDELMITYRHSLKQVQNDFSNMLQFTEKKIPRLQCIKIQK